MAEDSAPSRQDGGLSKRDCFIRFDEVNHWHSRTRELIATAETHSYPVFRKFFRELRRESRKAEFDAVENKTHRAIVTVAAFTGLSLSELRGLKWEDIDFKAKTITVNRKFWRTHEGQTKTEARQAPVPMISPVRIALSAYRKTNPGTTYVFEGPFQKPLDIATIGTKRVKPAIPVEWYGWHAFRRGLATNLHELEVPDKDIQAILRHSNVATTQKSYIKSRAAAGVAAMRRLEAKVKK